MAQHSNFWQNAGSVGGFRVCWTWKTARQKWPLTMLHVLCGRGSFIFVVHMQLVGSTLGACTLVCCKNRSSFLPSCYFPPPYDCLHPKINNSRVILWCTLWKILCLKSRKHISLVVDDSVVKVWLKSRHRVLQRFAQSMLQAGFTIMKFSCDRHPGGVKKFQIEEL